MMNIKVTLLLLTLLGGSGVCHAAASGGADPLNFLFLDANARPVAMGGAYTALAADANALLYNPAGLGRIKKHEATFMHNQYFQSISQEYAAYVSPYGWGVNLNYLSFGKVQETTLANPDGTGLGTAGLTDLAVTVGYGHSIGVDLSLGAGVKYISESIAGTLAKGFAVDMGALYTVAGAPGLSLGAAAQNIGPKIKYEKENANLPLNFRFGSAYAFKVGGQQNLLAVDVTKQRNGQALFGVGAETVILGMMPVRVGFTSRNDIGLGMTAGVGWIHEELRLDYAIVPYGELGLAHRVSAAWRWGKVLK